jgi:hypothetical protein
VEHIYGASVEPIKIKLVKGQKDSYGWEISCAGSDMADILTKLRAADAALKSEWGLRDEIVVHPREAKKEREKKMGNGDPASLEEGSL